MKPLFSDISCCVDKTIRKELVALKGPFSYRKMFNLRNRRGFCLVSSEHRRHPWRWQSSFWHARCRWRHHGWHSPGKPSRHHGSLRRWGPEIRFTPPLRARRRIAGLVIPWMLSRSTLRWRLAPPFPNPFPPLPRPDILNQKTWRIECTANGTKHIYLPSDTHECGRSWKHTTWEDITFINQWKHYLG